MDIYCKVHAICDLLDELCETAHAEGWNVGQWREAQRLIWNAFAERECPQLMLESA